jgi:deazaflavin-dependent oxidoreductase (nitroreductase family)
MIPGSDQLHREVQMADDDYCYLTTTGRRTGNPHRIEIWYAAAPGALYLLAGGGTGSDWVQNLVAEPSVIVEIDGDEHRASGRLIEDAGEDARARTLVFDKYQPRYDGDLTEWRGRALPIALDLEDGRVEV